MKTFHGKLMLGYETSIERRAAGHHNPGRVATVRCRYGLRRLALDAGNGDAVEFFYDVERLYCLTTNHGLDYAGLQAWSWDCLKGQEDSSLQASDGNLFCQGSESLDETLQRKDSLQLASITLARRLADYLE